MGWHHDAFCDWQPIRPMKCEPCIGGCGVYVDSADGLCRACSKARQDSVVKDSLITDRKPVQSASLPDESAAVPRRNAR